MPVLILLSLTYKHMKLQNALLLISVLIILSLTAGTSFADLREVTFFNPPDACGTVSFQELYNDDGGLIAVKTYYYRAKNPRILDRMVLTGLSRNIIRDFDCDFFGILHTPRFICLDSNANIIIEKEKAVFVQPFIAKISATSQNYYSAGVLVKTVRTISVCSNALRGTGMTNCSYVW